MENKAPWKSKTLWLNLIVGIVALIPNPEIQAAFSESNLIILLSGLNLILRMVTKDKIGLD